MLPSAQGNELHAPVAETKLSRGGVGSVSCTEAASEGPLFVTLIVYVTFVPGLAVAGPVLVTKRSASCTMPVGPTVALSFAELKSGGDDAATLTVFVTEPLAFDGTAYLLVIVTVVNAVIVAMVHGNGVVHAPLFETNANPAGVGSVTVTDVASLRPLFVMLIV